MYVAKHGETEIVVEKVKLKDVIISNVRANLFSKELALNLFNYSIIKDADTHLRSGLLLDGMLDFCINAKQGLMEQLNIMSNCNIDSNKANHSITRMAIFK